MQLADIAHAMLADLRLLAADVTNESVWARHVEEGRARVATWRPIPAFSRAWSPIPHIAQREPALFRYPLPGPIDERRADRAGFDEAGRLVLVEDSRSSPPLEVWDHATDTMLERRSGGGAWRFVRGPDRRVVGMVGAVGSGAVLQAWHWSGDVLARVDETWVTPDWSSCDAREADHDASGAVLRIRGARTSAEGTPDSSPAVLAETLAQAAALRCDEVLWNAAKSAYRRLRADTSGMAQQLADGLAEAVAAAVAAVGVVEPFCVRVASSGAGSGPSGPSGRRLTRRGFRGWRSRVRSPG
jgi:hypothetical protein